ncbi:MAG: hypothetical protein U1E73_01150 [Planctomycetota bacterium]
MKPSRVLSLLLPALSLAASGAAQDAAPTDWPKEVDRACTSKRYGLRLAAARKVAEGGGAAVAAIAAWSTAHGRTAIPSTLVDAIAKDAGTDAPVVALLRDWAEDRDFYWRAMAFEGLARRAPRLGDHATALRALFTAHVDDAAWLARTYSRFGLLQLGDAAAADRPEADPRAATRLAALVVQVGGTPRVQPLLDAIGAGRTFLGVPWGQARAAEARTALKALLGDDWPAGDAPSPAAIAAAAARKTGQDLVAPAPLADPERAAVEGLEVLSCRDGDVFVQWDAAGTLWFGIDGAMRVDLGAAKWDELSKKRADLGLGANLGEVICDRIRLAWTAPPAACTIAPGALPKPAAEWLEQLATAVSGADKPELASALRSVIEQFGAR